MSRLCLLLAVLVPGGLLAGPAYALQIAFRTVADTSTPVPGGSGTFFAFHDPVVDGAHVAFRGFSVDESGMVDSAGVYAETGGTLRRVADTSTPVPGGTGSFGNLANIVSIDGGRTGFGASNPPQSGSYVEEAGSLRVLADTGTPIPGGTGSFTSAGLASLDGGRAAFAGTGASGQAGLYLESGGSLSVLYDTGTPIPGGGGTFESFGPPVLDAGSVAFWGGFGNGIYTDVGGSLRVVADPGTPAPGDTGTFVSFDTDFDNHPSLGSGSVAFRATTSSGQRGVYVDRGGVLQVVADNDTPIPGGTGTFTGHFADVAADGDRVAFRSAGGIHIWIAGILHEVLVPGDELDGKTVSGAALAREALRGDQLALRVGFGDGSSGIFVATVPEPATGLLLALGVTWLGARRRRARRGSGAGRAGRAS